MRSIVERYHAVVRRVARQVADEMAAKPRVAPVEAPRPTAPERRKQAAFARRQARYEQAERLLADGLPLRDAAVRLGVDPRTLRRWRELGHAPLWDRRPSGSILDPFRAHLERRWAEGCGNARQLWRELVGLGFAGRPSIVRVWTGRRRKADAGAGVPSPGQVPRPRRWKPPSIHKLTRLLTAGPGEPSEPDRLLCDRLLAQQPDSGGGRGRGPALGRSLAQGGHGQAGRRAGRGGQRRRWRASPKAWNATLSPSRTRWSCRGPRARSKDR